MAWHVLVVEDELDSQEIVQAMLTFEGIQADVVGTAEEALTRLAKDEYHAAVIDLMLPGMDGLDLARRIRTTQKIANLPCIAITAYGSATLRREASEAGYNLYYGKPIAQEDLAQVLRKLLS